MHRLNGESGGRPIPVAQLPSGDVLPIAVNGTLFSSNLGQSTLSRVQKGENTWQLANVVKPATPAAAAAYWQWLRFVVAVVGTHEGPTVAAGIQLRSLIAAAVVGR